MEAVLSEILLQHALFIDQGREVIQIDDLVLGAVVLEPVIEFQNPLLRALGKEIFRAVGVVVHR